MHSTQESYQTFCASLSGPTGSPKPADGKDAKSPATTLSENAKKFLKEAKRPPRNPLVTDVKDLLATNLHICETDHSNLARRFLCENMQFLKTNGFEFLFLGLPYELQDKLDIWYESKKMPAELEPHLTCLNNEAGLIFNDKHELVIAKYNYTDVIQCAHECRMRVVALSIASKADNTEEGEENIAISNYIAFKIIQREKAKLGTGKKYLSLINVLCAREKTMDSWGQKTSFTDSEGHVRVQVRPAKIAGIIDLTGDRVCCISGPVINNRPPKREYGLNYWTEKLGHIDFYYNGPASSRLDFFEQTIPNLAISDTAFHCFTRNQEDRKAAEYDHDRHERELFLQILIKHAAEKHPTSQYELAKFYHGLIRHDNFTAEEKIKFLRWALFWTGQAAANGHTKAAVHLPKLMQQVAAQQSSAPAAPVAAPPTNRPSATANRKRKIEIIDEEQEQLAKRKKGPSPS